MFWLQNQLQRHHVQSGKVVDDRFFTEGFFRDKSFHAARDLYVARLMAAGKFCASYLLLFTGPFPAFLHINNGIPGDENDGLAFTFF